MLGSTYSKIRTRYGRLLTAVALLVGAAAFSIGLEPRGSIAADVDETTLEATQSPQDGAKPKAQHAVLRFGEVYVAYAIHPAPGGPCWSVHSLSGEGLGIFADEKALTTLFPEVDTATLHQAALNPDQRTE